MKTLLQLKLDWNSCRRPNKCHEEGIYIGYRYFNTFNIQPSYEFGYGLSYTTFDSNLTLGSKTFKDKMTVSVTNSGKTAGKSS
jgi:beta-glucosidase